MFLATLYRARHYRPVHLRRLELRYASFSLYSFSRLLTRNGHNVLRHFTPEPNTHFKAGYSHFIMNIVFRFREREFQ